MGFIDAQRAQGRAVGSICRVLREQGCQIAARTYRAWRTRQPSARTLSDATVVEAITQIAYTLDLRGRRRLTAEGLYGRRKMLACLRRHGVDATPGAVDRGMRHLGLSGVVRTKQVRTTIPGKDGHRADLSRWSAEDLEAVALALNNRPRKSLDWKTPAEVFEEQLRSLQQPGVATTG